MDNLQVRIMKIRPSSKVLAHIFLFIAVVTNLVSLYLHFSTDYLYPTNQTRWAAFLWVTSVLMAGISAWLYSFTLEKSQNTTKKQSLLASIKLSGRELLTSPTFRFLFPVLLLALILRILFIMNNGLYLDEWYWLDAAKSILNGSAISPFGFVGDYASNLPAYPVALLLAITKNPMLSVRRTGVIFSLMTIIFAYELLKELAGIKPAIVVSLLLAVSAWDIHMADLGYTNTNINPLLAAWALLLLYKIKSDKYTIRTLFVLALLLAICIHLLYVAALLVISSGLVLAIVWFRKRATAKLTEVVLFSVYFLIRLSPLLPKLVKYPDQSLGRHLDFLQQNVTLSVASKSPLTYYADQIGLLYQDYTTGSTNFPLGGLWGITIDPAIQVLCILGIIILIVQLIRKKDNPFWWIILFTFSILLLIPLVILYRSASAWRAYIVLPMIYLFATYSIFKGAEFLKYVTKAPHFFAGLQKYYLPTIILLYFIVCIPWFIDFSKALATRGPRYENTICQYATDLINSEIPKGSTILMPNEMCFQLITIRYVGDQYHFVSIDTGNSAPVVVNPGSYIVLFNSQEQGGYYRADDQKIAEQIIADHNGTMISPQATSQPVVYHLKY